MQAFDKIEILQGVISFYVVADFADIIDIEISPEFRGKGYGSILLNQFIMDMRARSVAEITLEVRVDNAVAIGLYKKFGFAKVGIRKGYYKGIDGILMKKELN
jgi:ribosomal-protein-alanine N-acetyltransferase